MAVYFLKSGSSDAVKIGCAHHVGARISMLQTSHHEPLALLREVPGYKRVEKFFHRKFADRLLLNEWFRFSEDMLTAEADEELTFADQAEGHNRPERPNPERFLHCLSALRWSASGVAVWCGYARQSGLWWATGRVSVPEPVGAWLEARMVGGLDEPPGR